LNLQSVAIAAANLTFRAERFEAVELADHALGRWLEAGRALDAAWRTELRTPAPRADSTVGAGTVDDRLLAESLASEMPVRIAAAVFSDLDGRCGVRHAAPIARHLLAILLDIKRTLLQGILDGSQPLGALYRMDRFRKRCERWCDLLLSRLPDHPAVADLAVDRRRFFDHRVQMQTEPVNPLRQTLILAGMSKAFSREPASPKRGELISAFAAATDSLLATPLNQARPLRTIGSDTASIKNLKFPAVASPDPSPPESILNMRFRRLLNLGRDRQPPFTTDDRAGLE
jgi:hypothetical protein